MGDLECECERVVPEIVDGTFAAQALAGQVQALADRVQALANQAQIPADQAPVDQAQGLAHQAQALANQAQALANQAQALVASNNNVDQEEKSVHAYKVIANLHDINLHYPIHKLALHDWRRTEENLSNSVSRKEDRSAELTNQIYQIIGLFAVFLGLVLSAVSQLTQTGNAGVCEKLWLPIVLTVFTTVVTIVGILLKFKSLQSLESRIHTERQAKLEVANRLSFLRTEGPQKFKFHKDTNNSVLPTKAKLSWKNRILVIVPLVIFTGIIILFYFVILCHI